MSLVSEEMFIQGSPSQEPDPGKQEIQNLSGSSSKNQSIGIGSNLEGGSRNKRRDLGRAEYRYV